MSSGKFTYTGGGFSSHTPAFDGLWSGAASGKSSSFTGGLDAGSLSSDHVFGTANTRTAGYLFQVHNNGAIKWGVDFEGKMVISPTQTTVGGAGAASALPANPEGYFKIVKGISTYVVPYYLRV